MEHYLIKLDYHALTGKQKLQIRRRLSRRKFRKYIVKKTKSYFVIHQYLFEFLQYDFENDKLYKQAIFTLYQQLPKSEWKKHHSKLKIVDRDVPCSFQSSKYNAMLRHIYY